MVREPFRAIHVIFCEFQDTIIAFFKKHNVTDIVFVPYALKDHDKYTSTMAEPLEAMGFKVRGQNLIRISFKIFHAFQRDFQPGPCLAFPRGHCFLQVFILSQLRKKP